MTHVVSGSLNSPYRRAFLQLPSCIQSALWDSGYSRTQPDGELLEESLTIEQSEQNESSLWNTDLGASIITKCMEYNDLTQELTEVRGQVTGHHLRDSIAVSLQELVGLVPCGKQTLSYSSFEIELATLDRHNCFQQFAPLSELSLITKRWRHWKPRSGNHTPATTQRVMELTLRERWLERLLAPFILKRHKIRNMLTLDTAAGGADWASTAAKGADGEVLREYKHLMGTARYRTLRVHCLNLEHMIKAGLPIPWEEKDLRTVLNTLLDEEATPSKVNRLWYTLSWISRKLGLLDADSLPRLTEKKRSILEQLATTVTKPQKKATVPSLSVTQALEIGAVDDTIGTSTDRYLLSVVRFMVGASARFDDIQHSSPAAMKFTETTCEVLSWQTKTTSAAQIHQKPCPLISPLLSFAKVQWWDTLKSGCLEIQSLQAADEVADYLLPTISRDRTGIILRPISPSRSLSWLKFALLERGVQESEVLPLSWHSFRVFIPDRAFQNNIPREQRRYLGNWNQESTADVYIRSKRQVVCQIWNRIMISPETGEENREARIDLGHPDWEDGPAAGGAEQSPSKSSQSSTPTKSWTMVEPEESPEKRIKSLPGKSSCELPSTSGPLSLAIRKARTQCGKFMHWLDTTGRAVGCGWRPATGNWESLIPDEYHSSKHEYSQCSKCFRTHTVPPPQGGIPETEENADTSDDEYTSCGSLSDDSVDSDSDAEASKLTLKP